MAKYLPTPKVTAALVVGVLALGAVLAADALGMGELRAEAQSVVVLALSTLGAWLKRDQSSPEHDDHGVEL